MPNYAIGLVSNYRLVDVILLLTLKEKGWSILALCRSAIMKASLWARCQATRGNSLCPGLGVFLSVNLGVEEIPMLRCTLGLQSCVIHHDLCVWLHCMVLYISAVVFLQVWLLGHTWFLWFLFSILSFPLAASARHHVTSKGMPSLGGGNHRHADRPNSSN